MKILIVILLYGALSFLLAFIVGLMLAWKIVNYTERLNKFDVAYEKVFNKAFLYKTYFKAHVEVTGVTKGVILVNIIDVLVWPLIFVRFYKNYKKIIEEL